MATYRNKQDDTIIRGSEFKLIISMDVIDTYHMGDVNFFCTFNAGGKVVLLTKEDMIEVDEDNYLAPLDSNDFNKGVMCIRYEADIPDEAFADGFRHVKIDILSADASKRLIGSSNTSFEYYLSSSSKLSVRSNNAATNSSKTPGTGGRHTYRISNATNKYYYDSTSYNFTHNGTSYQGASLYLLIRPSSTSTGISARLYSCTIKEGDTLLRDFIPVRKDGIGYLYDRVSGELFGNAGTGSFTLGSDVT